MRPMSVDQEFTMTNKVLTWGAAALMAAGYFKLEMTRDYSADPGLPLLLMGAGALVFMLPFFMAGLAIKKLPGAAGRDRQLQLLGAVLRLRYLGAAAVVAGVVGLQMSPGGVNASTLFFFGLAAGALLCYVAGRVLLGGPGAFSALRLFITAAAVFGCIISGVTLIIHLSGASDMPARWNIYSLLGALGLAVSAGTLISMAGGITMGEKGKAGSGRRI